MKKLRLLPIAETGHDARVMQKGSSLERWYVFDYIERFYNPRRRHSTTGYLSPVAFEEQMRLA
jgi:putative transposase